MHIFRHFEYLIFSLYLLFFDRMFVEMECLIRLYYFNSRLPHACCYVYLLVPTDVSLLRFSKKATESLHSKLSFLI